MTKKMMQKKSKATAQAAKPAAKKTTAAATKAVSAKKTVASAVKSGANVGKSAVNAGQKVKSEPVPSKIEKTPEVLVADVKPAVSGREAARLALVQKAATSKWASLYSKAGKIQASPYNLKNQYEVETAINHKTLGWGYIQDKKNDRLEVLFENGIKYLISNYK